LTHAKALGFILVDVEIGLQKPTDHNGRFGVWTQLDLYRLFAER
jgi:hypothetical protein